MDPRTREQLLTGHRSLVIPGGLGLSQAAQNQKSQPQPPRPGYCGWPGEQAREALDPLTVRGRCRSC
jgi:hypothetical protein